MATQDISEAVRLLASLHDDAKRYLHARSDLEPFGIIARLAYLMGEMQAPLSVLAKHCPPAKADEE